MSVIRTIVEGDKTIVLRRRAEHLELVLGNVVLLSSAALETERAFGQLAAGPNRGRILVGGLGFGATVAGVLDVAAPEAEVVVVEKLHAVVDVARHEAAHLVGSALDDPRVTVHERDVADVIAEAPPRHFGAILLDVDNGPEWASFRSNARLYAEPALVRAHRALMPGGMLAVWSGYPADGFVRSLRRAGFVPAVRPLHERGVVRARAYVGTT